jgi:tripartite-type tricarboxylate transporter receptor subunit TctC
MVRRSSFIAFVCLLMCGAAAAQSWPSRNVRVIVPLTAGSAVDIVPRIVFEQVGAQLGQSFVVENRTGASGTIGTRAVATASPDGYTLLAHSSALIVSPFTVANANYDPTRDFAPVAPLGSLPNVLVVAPTANIKTVQDYVARARTRRMIFGSAGIGTPVHLAMEKFRLATGIAGDFVPYRGAPEVLTDVMTGRIDSYYAPLSVALEFVRTGKLVALCVSGTERSLALPDVPTSIEAGYAESDLNFWIGVFAPTAIPRDVVEKLNHEIGVALSNPGVREKLLIQGIEPMPMDTAKFAAFMRSEVAATGKLAKTLNLTPQ